jgi:hypothetical protein
MKPQPFCEDIAEYRNQLKKGLVPAVYRGITDYISQLRLQLKKNHPTFFVSGVHYGQMDYTYFYFFPQTLKRKKLKVVLIFFHESFKFEIWLSGYNKATQVKFWEFLKATGFNKYPLAADPRSGDSIVQIPLNANPDFSNPVALTTQLERSAIDFIKEIESYLNKQHSTL